MAAAMAASTARAIAKPNAVRIKMPPTHVILYPIPSVKKPSHYSTVTGAAARMHGTASIAPPVAVRVCLKGEARIVPRRGGVV
jgi:hypothetical protein